MMSRRALGISLVEGGARCKELSRRGKGKAGVPEAAGWRLRCAAVAIGFALLVASSPADSAPEVSPPEISPPAIAPSEIAPSEIAPPGEESGLLHPRHRDSFHLGRALLWIPRGVLAVVFMGPELVAEGVDDYIESRGPNVSGRGNKPSRWRFGAMLGWEKPFGAALGGRIGYEIHPHAVADLKIAGLGIHGLTLAAGWSFGRFGGHRLAPRMDASYRRGGDGLFGGIGGGEVENAGDPYRRGPAAEVAETVASAGASATLRIAGPIWGRTAAGIESQRIQDRGSAPLSSLYDAGELVGFDESVSATVGAAGLVFDTRRAVYDWNPASAPATGWRLEASAELLAGEASRSGTFSALKWQLEALRLFDLFRGNRVLSLRGRAESIEGDLGAIPYFYLPTLGGPDALRGLARGRLRDRVATFAELRYEWALGLATRAFLFAETGAVHPSVAGFALSRSIGGGGGGIRFLGESSTSASVELAGSSEGSLGFYLKIGGI